MLTTYEAPLFGNVNNSGHRVSIILKDKGNGELFYTDRYGILPFGFPEIPGSGEEFVSDPDSYELITYYSLPAEKAAEWLERHIQY